MEFDWTDPPFNPKDAPTIREIEESIEDPHGLRFFPDSQRFADESRTFSLGKTLTGRGIFSVYRADGKKFRVIAARQMSEEEEAYFERKMQEWNA